MNLDVSKPATTTMDATITMDLSSFGNSLNSSDLLNDPYSVINQLNSTFPGITPVTNDISEPSGNNDDGGDSLYEKQYTTLTSRTILQTAVAATSSEVRDNELRTLLQSWELGGLADHLIGND